MTTTFRAKLAQGRVSEGVIATWLRSVCGYHILPVYELERETNKGPVAFLDNGTPLVAPDMLAFRRDSTKWIEAKHKSVFTWYRKDGCWTTGIDRRHWRHYCELSMNSPWPIWLLFLHQQDRTDTRSEPWPCPTGLFGERLSHLFLHVNHESDKWGSHGMVYWRHGTLRLLAHLDSVYAA